MGLFSVIKGKIKKAASEAKSGFTNIIKKPLIDRKIGEFHFRRAGARDLPTYKKYKPLITYLQGINEGLMEIETNFEEVTDVIMPQVDDLYRDIGSYTDIGLIEFEQDYASKGTSTNHKNGKFEDFDIEKIEINGKKFNFKIPPKKTVYFEQDDRKEEVTYFGYDRIEDWKKEYNRLVDEACDHTLSFINRNTNDSKKEEKIKYVEVVREKFQERFNHLFRGQKWIEGTTQDIGGYEKLFHTTYLRHILDRLGTEYDSLWNKIMPILPKKVKYKHTYKIAVPVFKGYDGVEIDRLENHGINPPVDERGRSWEVGNDRKILIGPNKGKQVPKHMIKKLPLHKVVSWVANEYDAYRDDIRDGRWHPESLTVTDYLMANHPGVGREWQKQPETELKTDYRNRANDSRIYKMKTYDGRTIKGIRRPNNLNPSFDLRFFTRSAFGTVGETGGKTWKHIGRSYYYDDVSGIAKKEQRDPMVSTRGTAIFLIDKIISESMSLEEAHKDLKKIGKKAGFDFGPRAFGGALCRDPFNINAAGANESTKPKNR